MLLNRLQNLKDANVHLEAFIMASPQAGADIEGNLAVWKAMLDKSRLDAVPKLEPADETGQVVSDADEDEEAEYFPNLHTRITVRTRA